ncbi:hypothetical protein, partial [Leptospira ognonensis]|uniref:hypothetical protein n=1 Tax=Leptospira ognonensis TaxID=2484945 RepID=UPI001438269B
SILFNSGKLTDNYAAFIIENCNEQICLYLFNYLTLYPELFNEEVIVEAYQKRKIEKRGILQSILTGAINPKFAFSSKKKLIEYFINSEDKIDEIFNLISLYLIKIESDMPSLEELFKSIAKSSKMKEILDKLIPYLKIRKWQRIDVIQGIIPEYFL